MKLTAQSKRELNTRKALLSKSTSFSSSVSVSAFSGSESESKTVQNAPITSLKVKGKSKFKMECELTQLVSDCSEDSDVAQIDAQICQRAFLPRSSDLICDSGASGNEPDNDGDDCGKKSLTESELMELHETCAKLYLAKKISPVNAFNLQLVEYMPEILRLETFQSRNLVGRVHVVEIGSKIHEGRVDHVGRSITKLSEDVAVNLVTLENDNDEEIAENQHSSFEMAQKKEKNRKKSRFIVDDESKITTRFEDQSIKYSHRRKTLRNLFFKNIEEEVEFEYLRYNDGLISFSFFLNTEATHPLKKPVELEALGFDAEWPDEPLGFQPPKWLPFAAVNKWDPAVHDLWGLVLAPQEGETSRDTDSHIVMLPICEDFAHDPDRATNASPVSTAASFQPNSDDLQGVDNPTENAMLNEDLDVSSAHSRPRVNIDTVKTLNDLEIAFEQMSLRHVPMRSPHGWVGPLFVHGVNPVVKHKGKQRGASAKFINMEAINFRSPGNCYQNSPPEKIELSAGLLIRWSGRENKSYLQNFMNATLVPRFEGCHDYPYEFLDTDHHSCLETYFTNPSRSYLEADAVPTQTTEVELQEPASLEDEILQVDDLRGQHALDTETEEFLRNEFENTDAIIEPTEDRSLTSESNGQGCEHFDFQEFFPNLRLIGKDPEEAEDMDVPECRIRYCMRPRPVNMLALKKAIFEFLQEELQLNELGKPLKAEETTTNLPMLMQSLKERLTDRNRENVSLHLVVVALLHVVAENRLFLSALETSGCTVISRGRNWVHKNNIP